MPNEKFGLSNVEKGTTEPDKQGVIWIDDTSGDVKLQYNAGGGTPAYKTLGGGAGTNALLDGSNHTDTTASTVTRGDIIIGSGASPTWDDLAIGRRGSYLSAGEYEPRYNPVMGYIGGRVPLCAMIAYSTSSGSYSQYNFGISTLTPAGANGTADFATAAAYIGPTTTQNGGFTTNVSVQPRMYPYFRARVKVTDNVDGNMWIGFGNSLGAAADPGGVSNVAAFRCRNGTDTNWQACTRDGTNPITAADTGIALDTSWHTFEVYTADGGTTWKFRIDGSEVASTTTTVPTTNTSINVAIYNVPVSSSTREFAIRSCYVLLGDITSTDGGAVFSDIEASSLLA